VVLRKTTGQRRGQSRGKSRALELFDPVTTEAKAEMEIHCL
jgi:hypothetical protein